MKKTLVIIAIAVLALGALGVGVAFAQGGQESFAGNGPSLQAGSGPLHSYMASALAEKLGLSVDDVNARLAAGDTMYDIAVSSGVEAQGFPTLMLDVRTSALDAAVKDGVITQSQADWMNSHGFGRGGMMYGYGDGDCPMFDGQGGQFGPQGSRGGYGPGMMGRGFGS